MNNFDNDTTGAPNANDFLGGNFLRKEDLEGPVAVTIVDIRTEAVRDWARKKLVACFREYEKPLILNKTNIRRLAEIFRTGDTGAWRGPLTLFVDPGVEYAGRIVGGIRVRRATRTAVTDRTGGQSPMTNGQANGHDVHGIEIL